MNNIMINIKQTKQNFGIEFQCKAGENLLYLAKDSFLLENGSCELFGANGEKIYRYEASILNIVGELTKAPRLPAGTGVIYDEQRQAKWAFTRHGVSKDQYYGMTYDNIEYSFYTYYAGKAAMILVYRGDVQIAQVIKSTITSEYLDQYCMYLSGEYESLQSILCFAVILYDKFEFGNQREAFIGGKTDVSFGWTVSGIGKKYYNPNFMKQNFPEVGDLEVELSAGNVANALKEGLNESVKGTFTVENLIKGFINPLAIGLAVFAIVLVGVILGLAISPIVGVGIAIVIAIFFAMFVFSCYLMCKPGKRVLGVLAMVLTYVFVFIVVGIIIICATW